ncbi:hypothetical protein NI385_25895 (plasmid) [Vibrio parahaemolyticus]|nr:hypothetical protein [Vibrio parahaemolyticus]MCS0328228.1 hypothetical protein [Vibrio diabolicus]WMN80847.1 hypothetical protein NI385_25895 [Vibrio parahaemolyticus]
MMTGSTVALIAKLQSNGWHHSIRNVNSTAYCVDSLSKDGVTIIDICTIKSRLVDGVEVSERFLSAYITTFEHDFEIDTLKGLFHWLESKNFIESEHSLNESEQ